MSAQSSPLSWSSRRCGATWKRKPRAKQVPWEASSLKGNFISWPTLQPSCAFATTTAAARPGTIIRSSIGNHSRGLTHASAFSIIGPALSAGHVAGARAIHRGSGRGSGHLTGTIAVANGVGNSPLTWRCSCNDNSRSPQPANLPQPTAGSLPRAGSAPSAPSADPFGFATMKELLEAAIKHTRTTSANLLVKSGNLEQHKLNRRATSGSTRPSGNCTSPSPPRHKWRWNHCLKLTGQQGTLLQPGAGCPARQKVPWSNKNSGNCERQKRRQKPKPKRRRKPNQKWKSNANSRYARFRPAPSARMPASPSQPTSQPAQGQQRRPGNDRGAGGFTNVRGLFVLNPCHR